MNTQVTITTNESNIAVKAPFCAKNNNKFRTVCGKFSSGEWVFSNTEPARNMLAELFGASDETVTIRVELRDSRVWGCDGQIGLAGYVIAERRNRDWAVKLSDGATLVAGTFAGSGGSTKSPRVTYSDDAAVDLVVRRDIAERMGFVAPDTKKNPETVDVSVGGIPHRLTIEQANALLAELTAKLA